MTHDDPSLRRLIPDYLHHSKIIAVIITDLEGRIIYNNDHYKQIFCPDSNLRITGNYFAETVHPEDLDQAIKAAAKCITQPDAPAPVRVQLRKPGSARNEWLNTRWEFSLFTDGQGNPLGVLAIGQDLTMDEKNRENLHLSAVKLEAILNSTTDGNILISRDYKVMTFNKSAAEGALLVFGKALYEGADIFEFVLPQDLDDFKNDTAQVLKGQPLTFDRYINGFWFQIRYYPVFDSKGNVSAFTMNTTNIDERKKAEEYRRALLGNLPDDLYVVHTDGSITDIRLHQEGLPTTEASQVRNLPVPINDVFTGGTGEKLLEQVKSAITESEPKELTFSALKNDTNSYFDARISPLQADSALVLVRDVSARVRAGKEREKFAVYQEQVSRNVPGVIYQFRMRTDGSMHFTFASEGVAELFDITPAQVKEDAVAALERIHPDDQQRFYASVEESARNLKTWELTFRIIRNSGKVVWAEAKSSPYREADGSTVWNGYIHDVTDRIQNQQQLQTSRSLLEESEHKLKQTIEAIPDPMLIFSEDFRIQFVNDKFEIVYGYTEEEVLNRTMEFLIPAERRAWHKTKQLNYLEASSRNTRMVSFVPTLSKAGEHIIVNSSLNTFTAGGQKFIIVIMQDVTELKNRQDIILKQNETLRQIAWQQSHELRRPVANILGICNYFDDVSPKSHAELNDIIGYLRSEIKELDAIIRETVKQANDSETPLNLPPPAPRSE